MRKQAGFLEDVAYGASEGRPKRRTVLPYVVIDGEIAVGELVEPSDATQNRGLPTSRWSEESSDACRRYGEGCVEIERAEPSLEGDTDRSCSLHLPARATRFSMRIIERMTINANTAMPPARMLASRQRDVST